MRPKVSRASRGQGQRLRVQSHNPITDNLDRKGPAPMTRWVLIPTLAASVVILTGCERTESVQTGLRGTSIIQLYKPSQLAKLQEINRIPDPEPSDPYDPSFPMATEVHQNVKVLTDLNALEFARLMNALTTWIAPEEGCAYCHNPANLASDEKFTKQVSRQMIQMTRAINTNWQSHVVETGVTCWTCHRGQPIPSDIWFNMPEPKTPSARVSGWKGGQNVAGIATNGYSSLPFDPLTPFLEQANQIAVQGVEVLPYGNRRSIKQAEWTYALMMYMSESLGVNCTYCHHTRAMGVWDQSSPQRVTAWHGIRMVRAINDAYLNPLKPLYPADRLGPEGDAPKAACATCHKGTYKPLFGQTMLNDYPSLAGVLPGRLDPDAEAAAIKALAAVYPSDRAERNGTVRADARVTEVDATPAEAGTDGLAGSEAPVAAAQEGDADAPTTDTTRLSSEDGAVGATVGERLSATEGEASSASAAQIAATEAVDSPAPLQGMTITEIEAALESLLQRVEVIRAELDEAAQSDVSTAAEPQGTAAAEGAGERAPSSEQRPEASDEADADQETGEQATTAPELTGLSRRDRIARLQTLLADQAAQLTAAKEAAAALNASERQIAAAESSLAAEQSSLDAEIAAASANGDSSAEELEALRALKAERLQAAQQRIEGLRARLEQERLALTQQLEVVREQRDSVAEKVATELADAHEDALGSMEEQLMAANARLEQERLALQQQLEVVREQRDNARAAKADAASTVDRDTHEEALADAEARLEAGEARLDQERHALQQQLAVVREQRDTARAQFENMIPRDQHEQALAALELKVQALQARLSQNAHALQQQLVVVRQQRDQAESETEKRVAELHAMHERALAEQRQKVEALQVRLDQNLYAMEQQLDVVRAQRDARQAPVEEQVAAATAAVTEVLEDQIGEQQALIEAMQARLDQNRQALEQQLAVVRLQRDAAAEQAEDQIAAFMDENETTLQGKRERIAAVQARLDQNRLALEQQLEVARSQRRAAEEASAAKIAALEQAHQAEVESLKQRIAAAETQLAERRSDLEATREDRGAEVNRLQGQLADANAELNELREQMTEAAAAHEQALADAKRSVTRIRLRQEDAAEVGGTVTEQGILVNLGSDELRFSSGSAALPASELPTLDRTAALLAARPELTARIEGHTDSIGSAEINKSLSMQRAQAVRRALIERGIDGARVTAIGAGSERPIADNGTPQGRRQNRRVEIYVTAEDEQINGGDGTAGAGGA